MNNSNLIDNSYQQLPQSLLQTCHQRPHHRPALSPFPGVSLLADSVHTHSLAQHSSVSVKPGLLCRDPGVRVWSSSSLPLPHSRTDTTPPPTPTSVGLCGCSAQLAFRGTQASSFPSSSLAKVSLLRSLS